MNIQAWLPWGLTGVISLLSKRLWRVSSSTTIQRHQCISAPIFCFCSVAKLCPTLCNPMDCSTPGFPILHHLPEFAQTHVHWVSDNIQPSHLPSSPSPPAFNFSRYQNIFQWVSSSHQVAKVLELSFSISPSNVYSGLISYCWRKTVIYCSITNYSKM